MTRFKLILFSAIFSTTVHAAISKRSQYLEYNNHVFQEGDHIVIRRNFFEGCKGRIIEFMERKDELEWYAVGLICKERLPGIYIVNGTDMEIYTN